MFVKSLVSRLQKWKRTNINSLVILNFQALIGKVINGLFLIFNHAVFSSAHWRNHIFFSSKFLPGRFFSISLLIREIFVYLLDGFLRPPPAFWTASSSPDKSNDWEMLLAGFDEEEVTGCSWSRSSSNRTVDVFKNEALEEHHDKSDTDTEDGVETEGRKVMRLQE